MRLRNAGRQTVRGSGRWRRLRFEFLEYRRLLAITCGDLPVPLNGLVAAEVNVAEGEGFATATNPSVPADVNADGYLSALDPLLVANYLDRFGEGPYTPDTLEPPLLDFNADALLELSDLDGVVQQVDQAGPGQLPEPRFELSSPDPLPLLGKLVSVRLGVVDDGGNPIERVELGQTFQLEAWVADLRGDTDPQGVFSSYVDAYYDSTKVTLDGGVTHGEDFAKYAAEDTAESGLINDVGSGRAEALLDDSERLLWRVPMRADGTGIADFIADASEVGVEYPTLLSGLDRPIPAQHIQFTGTSLFVSGAPVAVDNVYYVVQEQTLLVGGDQGVLANDQGDEGETLTAELVVDANHGTVRLNPDGSFEYNPEPGYAGWDEFRYQVSDGYFTSNEATVFINVIPGDAVLLAVDDNYVLESDGSLEVNVDSSVLSNDEHSDYPSTVAVLVSGVEHGSLVLAPDGSFVYTPDEDFNGRDEFSYRIDTGFAVSNVALVQLVAEDFDSDSDGVSDRVENGAPNGGDFNADGIPDRQQGHIASLKAADQSQYVMFQTQSSTPFRKMRTVAPPSGNGAPTAEFAYGFFGFEIHGLAPGGEVTATFQPEDALAGNLVYRVGPTPDNGNSHWYLFMRNHVAGATVYSDSVDILYADGAYGDDDLSVDGVITNLVLGIATAENPWRNPRLPEDVDNSGAVTPADALILINEINRGGMRLLPLIPEPGTAIPVFLDPSGDHQLSPEDVLQIINRMNEQAAGARLLVEGEPEAGAPVPEIPVSEAGADNDVQPATPASTASLLVPSSPLTAAPVATSSTYRSESVAWSAGGSAEEALAPVRLRDVSDSSEPQRATDASRGDDDELELAIDEIAVALSRAWLF